MNRLMDMLVYEALPALVITVISLGALFGAAKLVMWLFGA